MSVFVDTSALYAILNADDQNHEQAKRAWTDLVSQGTEIICTFDVMRRLGLKAAFTFDAHFAEQGFEQIS